MGRSLTYKIIEEHVAEGKIELGADIGLRVDQTLTAGHELLHQ